ncbi:MAG: hypothetical protein ABI685_05755 [Ferruginibacter sp.]
MGLLLLVALPLVISVCIFFKQTTLQNQRKQRFETEELQTITVSSEKINWIKHEKEIAIDGKLFDVESFKTSGNNTIFIGFYDNKEDKLVKHIKTVNQQKNDSNGMANQLAVKFLFCPNYKESISFSIQNTWQIVAHKFPVYTEVISSMAYPTIAPPPKYC